MTDGHIGRGAPGHESLVEHQHQKIFAAAKLAEAINTSLRCSRTSD